MTRPFHNSPRCPSRLAVIDIETTAPPPPDGQSFPPWPLHEPVVASILLATSQRYGQWQFELETISFGDGKAATERVSHLIEGRSVVGCGSRKIAVPVLAKTAMYHRCFDGSGIARAWRAHRFSDDHLDVMDLVANYGSGQEGSLEMLCSSLGIPASHLGFGSNVDGMKAMGSVTGSTKALEQKAASIFMLFAIIQGLRCTEPGYAGGLITQFGSWVRDQKLEHLRAFERIHGYAELDRLSLVHMLEEGIASLELRTHLAFVTGKPGDTGLMLPGYSDFPA